MRQQGVPGGADEAFDLELLLQGLEKDLDLPAVFVDQRDGLGRPGHVVGEKNDSFTRLGISGMDAPQAVRQLLMRIESFKFNRLIREDMRKMFRTPALDHTVRRVALQARDEVSASVTKGSVPLKIGVSSVEYNDVPLLERDKGRYSLFMDFAGCDRHKVGKVS